MLKYKIFYKEAAFLLALHTVYIINVYFIGAHDQILDTPSIEDFVKRWKPDILEIVCFNFLEGSMEE